MAFALLALTGISSPLKAQTADPNPVPKQIFVHYMGCYPPGIGTMNPARQRQDQSRFIPDGPTFLDRDGGRVRDRSLFPDDYQGTLDDAIDHEMRWAVRMGIDGFAIDVLAGRQTALDTLDAMFRVAEAKKYPIEITFCLDDPTLNLDAVRYLITHHGQSPNLARRNGKIFFAGYRSQRLGMRFHSELPASAWTGAEGAEACGEAVTELEKIAGEPIDVMFDLNGVNAVQEAPPAAADPSFWTPFMTELAKKFGVVGGFFWGGPIYDAAAQAAHAAGMDWAEPIWCQYENRWTLGIRMKGATDVLLERWAAAMKNDATVIEVATWNDYTESTNIAPGVETGYAYSGLMREMIARWKTGHFPEPDQDRVYVFYPPYPKGSRVYPYREYAPEMSGMLEVVSILSQPATIRLPGRNESWDAPAGLSVKKFDPSPGPVSASVIRDGKTVLSFTAREPITDRPYRAQHSYVGYSSDDARWWKEDFGDASPPAADYAAADDGTPNWFQRLRPALLPSDSQTTYAQYKAHADALVHGGVPPAPGTIWDLLQNPWGVSFNPETDPAGREVWNYLYQDTAESWKPLAWIKPYPPLVGVSMEIVHRSITSNSLDPNSNTPSEGDVIYQWQRSTPTSTEIHSDIQFHPVKDHAVAVSWTSPVDGTFHVSLAAEAPSGSKGGGLVLADSSGNILWRGAVDPSTPVSTETSVPMKQGERLLLQTDEGKITPVNLTRFTVEWKAVP